jgi:NAD(P)-dependent dehydrogenase (short-subunit alcohol dehydrogenase family)
MANDSTSSPSNRVAIITCSSRGIGASCARVIAAEGCRLALMSRTEQIHSIAAELGAVAVQGSVNEPADLQRLVDQTLATHGRIDVVVNSSGHPSGGELLEISDGHWSEVFEMYFLSVVRMSRLVVPAMLRQGSGCFINISGAGYNEPDPRFPVADTIRASLSAYTKLFARRYAKDGLRMNCVAPSVVFDHEPDSISADMKAALPIGRPARYDEVARVVAFLASDAASYVTGETLRVDGGLSASI